MILVEPEQRVADQKTSHLITAIVKNESVPIGVLSFPRVGMLVKVSSVEIAETGFIFREVRRNPVENHADPALMKIVHEIHEVGGSSKAAGGSEIAGRFVSPRTIKGVLHHGEQFHVGETGVVDIVRQQRGYFAVTEPPVIFLGHASPGP
jgi:hypothetical protein